MRHGNNGGVKRRPTLSEEQIRSLDRLSKADLMEVAFHFALLNTGNEDQAEAVQMVLREHVIIAQNGGFRPSVRLPSTDHSYQECQDLAACKVHGR